MGPYLLLLAQIPAPVSPTEAARSVPAPTLEIRASVRAETVIVEREGTVRVDLEGSPSAIPEVAVERNGSAGGSRYDDLKIDYAARLMLDPRVAEAGERVAPADPDQQGE